MSEGSFLSVSCLFREPTDSQNAFWSCNSFVGFIDFTRTFLLALACRLYACCISRTQNVLFLNGFFEQAEYFLVIAFAMIEYYFIIFRVVLFKHSLWAFITSYFHLSNTSIILDGMRELHQRVTFRCCHSWCLKRTEKNFFFSLELVNFSS